MTVRVRDVVAYGLAVKPPKVVVHDAVVYGATPRVTRVNVHDAVVYAASPPPPKGNVADATALVLSSDVRPGSLADATVLVLANDPTPVGARNPMAAVLTRDSAAVPDWTLKGRDWIMKILGKEFGASWETSGLVPSDPAVASSGQFNSNVKLTVPKGSKLPYSGSMRMKYNRWSIKRAFENVSTTTLPTLGADLHSSLDALNKAFKLALQPEDVVNQTFTGKVRRFTLTIAPTSLMYIPGTEVFLGSLLPSFGDEVEVVNLSGWDKPA